MENADASRSGIKSVVKVRIVGTTPFFGPGPFRLLEAISECGTVSAACDKMGISYSKGRSLIRNMEKEMNIVIVERSHGGSGGGNARLTSAGIDFLNRYKRFSDAVSTYAENIFPEYFEGME